MKVAPLLWPQSTFLTWSHEYLPILPISGQMSLPTGSPPSLTTPKKSSSTTLLCHGTLDLFPAPLLYAARILNHLMHYDCPLSLHTAVFTTFPLSFTVIPQLLAGPKWALRKFLHINNDEPDPDYSQAVFSPTHRLCAGECLRRLWILGPGTQ